MSTPTPHPGAAEFASLLRQARDGSTEVLGLLLDRYRAGLIAWVHRHFNGVVRSKIDASDVVQSAVLDAIASFPSFRGNSERALLSWLLRIVKGCHARCLRSLIDTEKRNVSREVPLADASRAEVSDPIAEPLEALVCTEEAARLQQAVDDLPDEERRVLHLHFWEQQSLGRIAGELGCSETAVRKKLVHLLSELQEYL